MLEPMNTITRYGSFVSRHIRNGKEKEIDRLIEGQHLNRASEEITAKIQRFAAKELGINNLYSVKIFEQKNAGFLVKAIGSLRNGALIFSSDFVKAVGKNMDNRHKFATAHEIAHLKADDSGTDYGQTFAKEAIKILAYSVHFCAFAVFLGGASGFVLGHIAGLCSMAFVECVYRHIWQVKQEKNADAYAACQSQELAQGGVELFTEQLKSNLNRLNNSPTLLGRCIAMIEFSPQGNQNWDFSHPRITERIEACRAYLK